MKLARPPHYVDGIAGGATAYDMYELMGYNYMAASFDGAGWMPQKGSFEEDAERTMVEPLRRALEADENALNGKIIFQKDGCNMSGFTPVAAALPRQLELLEHYGYRVCSVGELLAMSPFEDLPAEDECFESVRALIGKGFAVGCRNNTFNRDRVFTFGDLCMALCPKAERDRRVERLIGGNADVGGFDVKDPYAGALQWAKAAGLEKKKNDPASGGDMKKLLCAAGYGGAVTEKPRYTRAEAVCEIGRAVL